MPKEKSRRSEQLAVENLEPRQLLSGTAPSSLAGDTLILYKTTVDVGLNPNPDIDSVAFASSGNTANYESFLFTNQGEAITYSYNTTGASTSAIDDQTDNITINLTFNTATSGTGEFVFSGNSGNYDIGFVLFTSPVQNLAPANVAADNVALDISGGAGTYGSSGTTDALCGSDGSFNVISQGSVGNPETYTYTQSVSSEPVAEVLTAGGDSAASLAFLIYTSADSGFFYLTDAQNYNNLTDYAYGTFTVGSWATFSNGLLTVTGSAPTNDIEVTSGVSGLTASLDQVNDGPIAGVTGISVSAGGGEGVVGLLSVPTPATVIATNGFDTLYGSDGGDSIRAHGIDNFITGGAGSDTIVGPGGSDTLFASGSGNDFLKAKNTDNKLRGGTGGNDTLIGGSGGDTLKGHGGNNSIVAGSGAELIHGFAGNNTIVGGSGPDTITGNNGNNTITAGSGGGEIVAGFDNDSITGSTTGGYLADSIYCGSGFDTIVAGTADSIFNSTANDSITGGTIV